MHLVALVLKCSSEIKFVIIISSSRSRSSTQQQLYRRLQIVPCNKHSSDMIVGLYIWWLFGDVSEACPH